MKNLRRFLPSRSKPPAEEKPEVIKKLDKEIEASKGAKDRLAQLLEPTGFMLGDAIMGREEEEPWTPTTSD